MCNLPDGNHDPDDLQGKEPLEEGLWSCPEFFLCILKRAQLFLIQDSHHAPGQTYHALVLKIAEHSGDNLPVGPQMVGNGFMGDF